jgi:MFS family permease
MKITSNIIGILFISILIDFLEFTIILPLLPKILTYYGSGTGVSRDSLYVQTMSFVRFIQDLTGAPNHPKWNSVLFGGIVGSSFSLLQFFSSTLCGAASDRYGRKPVLLLSMIGIALSYAIWCVSFNLTVFMLARIIGGLSKANVAVILAIVSDTTSETERNRAMAWIGAAFSLGFIFGPLLGALCSQWGIAYWPQSTVIFFIFPAIVSLILSLINIGFISQYCPETLPITKRDAKKTTINDVYNLVVLWQLFKFNAIHNVKSVDDITILRRLGLASFIYMIIFAGLEFTITFLVYNRFNWNSMQQGKMFFIMGLCMALVQGGYVRRIPHGKEIIAAMSGIFVLIPSFILLGFAQSKTILWIGLVLFSIASSIVINVINSFASKYGLESEKGTILGIFRSLQALARAIGPLLASFAYWSIGERTTYIFGGLLLVCPLYILFAVQKRFERMRVMPTITVSEVKDD